MIQLIILLTLIAIGAYLVKKGIGDLLGLLIAMFSGTALVIHIIAWSLSIYEFKKFYHQRNAFSETLTSARENGNQYETAAIVKEVAEWNKELALLKYQNSIWFFDCYIDDRTEKLEPIK